MAARVSDRMAAQRMDGRVARYMGGRDAIPCAEVANMAEMACMADVAEMSMPTGAQENGGHQKQAREERAPQKQQRERICCKHPGASTHRSILPMHGQRPLTLPDASERSAAFDAAPGASGHAIRHQRAFVGWRARRWREPPRRAAPPRGA